MYRRMLSATVILAIFMPGFQVTKAADLEPMVEYRVSADYHFVRIEKIDWAAENRSYMDSIAYSNRIFARDVGWCLYDQVNNRIFFEEMLISPPHYTYVCDLNTMTVSNLPFANYSGGNVDMLISANSKYIVLSYVPQDSDTSAVGSPRFKTAVLDASNLKIIKEKTGIWLMTDSVPKRAFISGDGNYLFDIDYLPKGGAIKVDAIVTYTLPDLTPIDTTFLDDLGWIGPKGVSDLSGSKLLIRGRNNDDPALSPGRYMFVWDGSTCKMVSPLIPVSEQDDYIGLITPSGDEVVIIGKISGVMTRYSLPDGALVGETTGLLAIWGAFFRDDGNLYLRQQTVRGEAVVDYKNNRILKTITLSVLK